jgi:hypothetical protein
MMSYVLAIIPGFLVLAAVLRVAVDGFRNGDRATDALVEAVLRSAGQPGEDRPVVVATVRNPSAAPVLAGLAVRPARRPSSPRR